MTKKQHILISVGALVGGLVLCGYSWSTKLGHPASTVCLISGLIFSVGGFISVILALKRPDQG